MSLKPPPRDLGSRKLETETVEVSNLYRVSSYSSGEPHFGQTAANRFDDRSAVKSRRYGTSYFGLDLSTAIAETVLHDEMPVRGHFVVAYEHFASRNLVRFAVGGKLVLAKLTGPSLRFAGGDAEISTILDYRLPQLWSMAVHRTLDVDGILYVSRHLNDRMAVVLFERARHKLTEPRYTPLPRVPDCLSSVAELRISFKYT